MTRSTKSTSGFRLRSGDIAQELAFQRIQKALGLPAGKVEQVDVDLAPWHDGTVTLQKRIGLENEQIGLSSDCREPATQLGPVAVDDNLVIVSDQVAAFMADESREGSWNR